MTSRGRWYLVLVVITFSLAQNAGGSFPYFVFYLTTGPLVVAAVWNFWLARALRVEPEPIERRFTVGDLLAARTGFVNPTPFPARIVVCDYTGDVGEPEVVTVGVGPFSSRHVTRRLSLERRGRFRRGPLELEFGEPFGLFRARRRLEGSHTFVVYPRAIPAPALLIGQRQPFGRRTIQVGVFYDPTEIGGVRPLVPGDSLRHIHWKTSARRGELHVKEFDPRITSALMLMINLDASVQVGAGARRTDEYLVSLALGVAEQAIGEQIATGLMASGRRHTVVSPGHGAYQFRRLREQLVDAQADAAVDFAGWLVRQSRFVPAGATLVVLTPQLEFRMVRHLRRLRRSGHRVMVLCCRSEAFSPEREVDPRREEYAAALRRGGVPCQLLPDERGESGGFPGKGRSALRGVAANG